MHLSVHNMYAFVILCFFVLQIPKIFLQTWKNWEEKMVKNCASLPLAIVILGGILVTKPSLMEWEKVYALSLRSLEQGKGLGEDQQRVLFHVLVWSYNDFYPHNSSHVFCI